METADRIVLPADAAEPGKEPEKITISTRRLVGLVLALVSALSGLGWLNRPPGDYVTTREFDLFREQQRESNKRFGDKLDELLQKVGTAPAPEAAPSPRARRR